MVFMAFEEGNPVGFVQLYPSFSSVSMVRSWVLNDLYVKESARKKGFGEELFEGGHHFRTGNRRQGDFTRDR